MSVKINPPRPKISVSHVTRARSRVRAESVRGMKREKMKPEVTTASTPEPPNASANRYAAKGVTSEIVVSTGASSMRCVSQ